MHFEPGGASPLDDDDMFAADAQSARGGLHISEQEGLESPENLGPGRFSGRAEGVVQSEDALIDENAV